jgi:hypothetical protein
MNVQARMNRRGLTLSAALLAASAFAGCARRHADPALTATEAAPPAAPPPAAEPAPAAPSSLQSDQSAERDEFARVPISEQRSRTIADLEVALAEFERAKAELEGALRQSSNAASGGAAPGSAPAPARARPSSPPRAEAEAPKDRAEKKAASETSCQLACRAFASLERAADSVCRLAGPSDDRCTRAREIVTANTPRVASCGCRPDER